MSCPASSGGHYPGAGFVWVVDPASRRGWVHTSDAIREAKDGVLRTAPRKLTQPKGCATYTA